MYYIYQIIGNLNYKSVKFDCKTLDTQHLNTILNQQDEKQNLASIHIFKSLKVEQKKLIFLMPASVDTTSINIIDIITSWGLDEKDYDIIKMPANGTYKTGSFDYTPDEVLFFLYMDMVTRLKLGDTVFMDINAGLNEYVNSLNDALSYAYVTIGLLHLKVEKNQPVLEVYKIISEPVMRESNIETYTVYIQSVKRKIFFSLPLEEPLKPGSTLDADENTKIKFNLKFTNKQFYSKIINNNIIIFNSIKMNTLSIPIIDKNLLSKEMNKKILECRDEIIKIYSETFFWDISPGIRKSKIQGVSKIISFIMSLNMYLGFIDLLGQKLNDITDPENSYLINLEKLGIAADNIYRNPTINLPLNSEFLKRDIHEFLGYHERIKKSIESNADEKKSGSAKRNFFAHSGLDYNTVKPRCKGKVEFIGNLEERKKWLLSLYK